MMKVTEWLRNALTGSEARVPSQNTHGTGFLHLPGEIRNQIYAYIIYPNLKSITIPPHTESHHFKESVLTLALFRSSAQVRTEALSYLCANFSLVIMGLESAVLFFDIAGPAIREVKRMVIVQAAIEILENVIWRERVEKFFRGLGEMNDLSEMRLEGVRKMVSLGEGGEHASFLRRVELLRERGVDVQIRFGRRA